MLEKILFMIFAFMEAMIIFVSTLYLFRVKLKDYKKEIAITGIITSVLIFFAWNIFNSGHLAPLITFTSMFLSLVLLFEIRIIYSIWMSAAGGLFYLVTQTSILLLVGFILRINLSEMQDNDILRYSLQLFSFAVIILILFLMKRKRRHFNFIPVGKQSKFEVTRLNILIIVSLFIFLLSIIFMFEMDSLVKGLILFGVPFILMLALAIKKEKELIKKNAK